jgi:hypothetical protein
MISTACCSIVILLQGQASACIQLYMWLKYCHVCIVAGLHHVIVQSNLDTFVQQLVMLLSYHLQRAHLV